MTLYYVLNGIPLRLHKMSSSYGNPIVELRDSEGLPFVLPGTFVQTLPILKEPDNDSLWKDVQTGLPLIYRDGAFHHPNLKISLDQYLSNPKQVESLITQVDDFYDQLQGLMDDYHPEIQFSWNDGQVEARMDLSDAEVYGHGSSVDTALEEIAVRMFGVENGDDKL